MRSFLISDNIDTLAGMNMAGIEGVVLHEREEVLKKLDELRNAQDIGIIIVTELTADLIRETLNKIKLAKNEPLIVEIPDRHGSRKGKDSIVGYVRESIGLKI